MQYTGNYNLKKPEGTDVVNIQDFNDNTDIIDTQLKSLNDNKVDKVTGKQLSTNDYTTAEKNKLAGIADNANNYTHPTSHPASMITEDSSHRFVSDAEKNAWNSKASTSVATSAANGLMSSTDKSKLDGIASGANNYTHPSTHPATMITEDSTHRFVTDSEKATWNGKASTAVATTSVNGLMSSADKSKLDGIATGANNYVHPSTHPASIIVQDASNRFVTDTEKSTWNAKASTAVATASSNGLMSSSDKSKLDGIATAAEVNQNTFANVKVGATTIAADAKQDTLELVAGNAVTLTPDEANDKVTIAVNAASTSAAGSVQLNNTVTSTSTTQAATANVAKTAYDRAVTAESNAKTYADTAPENMLANVNRFATHRSNKDSNNGAFLTVEKRRKDGTLFEKAVFSNPNAAGNPTVRTVTTYAADGTTVVGMPIVFDISYDADGDYVSEVPR